MRTNEIRMLPLIPRHYVGKKSELTASINRRRREGLYTYRVEGLACECTDQSNLRADGAIIIEEYGEVLSYVIRCKSCFNKYVKEVSDGTI